METTGNKDWMEGELVTLPTKTKLLKKSGLSTYELMTGSRYVCIRKATDDEQGILVKVIGKVPADFIQFVGGHPFMKDDKAELFTGDCYYGYPFPALDEVKEVLRIIRHTPSLLSQFEAASMHINPQSTFWVKDTAKSMFVLKKPQYYDAWEDKLNVASRDIVAYRISVVYYSV